MSTIDDYLSGLPEAERDAFQRIADHVRSSIPGVEEGTSYGLPAFKHEGRPLLGFRAGKNHLSVFPFSPAAVEAARTELAGFDLSKGTVRFTPDQPIPDAALDALLRFRMAELAGG